MPYVNLNEVDLPKAPGTPKGKRRIIPRHVIRQMARDDFLSGTPGFSCPECHVNYAPTFGHLAKKGLFGERAIYCLDCIDGDPEIHKL